MRLHFESFDGELSADELFLLLTVYYQRTADNYFDRRTVQQLSGFDRGTCAELFRRLQARRLVDLDCESPRIEAAGIRAALDHINTDRHAGRRRLKVMMQSMVDLLSGNWSS